MLSRITVEVNFNGLINLMLQLITYKQENHVPLNNSLLQTIFIKKQMSRIVHILN